MRITILHITLLFIFFFTSCKEKEVTIDPISIPNPAKVLEGEWQIFQTKAEGNARIGSATVPVEGSNLNIPEGYYNLVVGDEENTYTYDVKALLQMRFGQNGNTKRNYDYDDHDAGTWELKSDQQITFFANQGNVQDVFFTHYDSADFEVLQLSIPVDTVLEGLDFDGKIVVDVIKSK